MSTSQHTTDPWVNRDGKIETMPDRNGAVLVIAEVYRSNINHEANAQLIASAPEMLEALTAISTNPHINLEDLVYQVREREGQGWDGPAVKAWSDACSAIKSVIAKATGKEAV